MTMMPDLLFVAPKVAGSSPVGHPPQQSIICRKNGETNGGSAAPALIYNSVLRAPPPQTPPDISASSPHRVRSSIRAPLLGSGCLSSPVHPLSNLGSSGRSKAQMSCTLGATNGLRTRFNISEGVRHRFIEGQDLPLVPRSGPCQLPETLTRAGRRALVESTVRRGADWSTCGL